MEYVILFLLAAAPWLEVLVVIPMGVAAGLPPLAVAAVSLVGNTVPVLLIVGLYDRWQTWRRRSRSGPHAPEAAEQPAMSRRALRVQRLWHRYGLPGLALLAPLVTGIHLATVMALAFGSGKAPVTSWMLSSLLLWTVILTPVAYYGFDLIGLVR